MSKGNIWYGTGRRKRAVARVWITKGKGDFIVNGKDAKETFTRVAHQHEINAPLQAAQLAGGLDIKASTHGGGISGQAGAVSHGLARAILDMDDKKRPDLKKEKLLTRDPREKERKKYGRKRARKRFQFSKR